MWRIEKVFNKNSEVTNKDINTDISNDSNCMYFHVTFYFYINI